MGGPLKLLLFGGQRNTQLFSVLLYVFVVEFLLRMGNPKAKVTGQLWSSGVYLLSFPFGKLKGPGPKNSETRRSGTK